MMEQSGKQEITLTIRSTSPKPGSGIQWSNLLHQQKNRDLHTLSEHQSFFKATICITLEITKCQPFTMRLRRVFIEKMRKVGEEIFNDHQ